MSKLKLGVARRDVTPKIGGLLLGYNLETLSTAINDNLSVTAFAFKSGNTNAMMINATVCVIGVTYCEEMRKEIAEKTDIPFDNIIISAIHTHSGPSLAEESDGWFFDKEYYETIFRPAVIEAALEASKNIEHVTVGCGCGDSYAGINRREISLRNTVVLGQNPWGPFNPEMNVISFKNDEQKIVANIITYSAHATAAGCNKEVTRDWPGIMIDAVENISGGLTAFFNTTMGDTGPRLSNGKTTGDGIAAVVEIGSIAAGDAVRIYNSINEYKDITLSVATSNLQLPLQPRVPYEEAVEYLDKLKVETNSKSSNSHLNGQVITFYTKVKESYENGYADKEFKEIPQTVIRVGDIVFAPFTFELFTEIALRIDKAVSDYKVISLSYTNGQMLYMPTEDQICRGGHEVRCFKYSNFQRYAHNSDYHLVMGTIKNIEKLER